MATCRKSKKPDPIKSKIRIPTSNFGFFKFAISHHLIFHATLAAEHPQYSPRRPVSKRNVSASDQSAAADDSALGSGK
jgi:hypothetical protein